MSRYKKEFDQCLANFKRNLAGLELSSLCCTEKVKCLRMAKAGTRIDSVQITFTPEGIAIQGDMCPGRHGACSGGYNLEWFAQDLDWSYLCEKFLTHTTVPECVLDRLDCCLQEAQADCDRARQIRDLIANIEADGLTPENHQAAHDLSGGDCGIGCGYNIRDAAILTAIQRRFVELFWVRCSCGRRVAITKRYRCIECGNVFCDACSERHFHGDCGSDSQKAQAERGATA